MIKDHISKEFIFGIAIPLGFTKKGEIAPRRAQESDQSIKLYSRAFRRSHVQLFGALLIAFLIVGLVIDNSSLATTLLGFSLLLPIVLIRISIYSLTDLPRSHLDEREIALKEESFSTAYKYVFLLSALLVSVIAVTGTAVSAHHFTVIGVSIVALIYTLPSALIAWSVKN